MSLTMEEVLVIVLLLIGLLGVVDYIGGFLAAIAIYFHERKRRR